MWSCEELIDLYDKRLISRRDLTRALMLLLVPTASGAQTAATTPVTRGHTINHVQLKSATYPRRRNSTQSWSEHRKSARTTQTRVGHGDA